MNKKFNKTARRARSTTYKDISTRLKKAFPDASQASLREVIILRIQAAASAFEAGLKKESEVAIEARAMVHVQYLERLEEMARDETIARPAEALRLHAEEAQWLTEITEGLCVCFGCRRGECRFYGANHQWIMVDLYHFRCPNCGEYYIPWADSKKVKSTGNYIKFLPYQTVIAITDIETGVQFAFPARWPGEAQDSWLLKQAEIYAAKLETPEDLTAYMKQSHSDLNTLLNKVGIPIGMKEFQWNTWVEDKLYGCPKEDTRDGVLGWNRLTKGFWGNILEEPPAGQEWNVMTDWTDLISVLGRIIFSVQKLRSKV